MRLVAPQPVGKPLPVAFTCCHDRPPAFPLVGLMMSMCGSSVMPLSTTRPFAFVAFSLKGTHSYVQDLFTIRPIAINYRYGIATPEILRGGWRGTAIRARLAQTARGSTGPLPADPGSRRRTRLQTFRSAAARREVERSRQAV